LKNSAQSKEYGTQNEQNPEEYQTEHRKEKRDNC
jgi:hypothetical protein